MDATMVIEGIAVAQGDTLVQMPLVVASIPTTRYDGDALTARDAAGPLPLVQKDGDPQPFGTLRDWQVGRATSGPVTVEFRALPRNVDANTQPGPLFDLRAEGGGLSGAGLAFLPHPLGDVSHELQLHWDLAGLPPGFRAASCLGDGDASTVAPVNALTDCYYAVGPLHVYPEGDDAAHRFGIYWLSDTPFDVPAVAGQLQTLFAYMAAFFHDAGGDYRVFIRRQPYPSGGGTALRRSFMFGWGTGGQVPTERSLQDLLAHEMTHNWPALAGDHGDVSWYAEGAAEYYSALLSWRSGAIDAAGFLERINSRARRYYQNPLQRLTLHQAEERYWQESNASYVPYGRGFMYLARTDAEIRARSGGKRSLDDLVVELADRARRGESHTPGDWLDLVASELGPGARGEYEDMVVGRLIVPPQNAFAPCFRPESSDVRLNQLGFDESSLRGKEKVIRGLRADSNAARAGLREGDLIVSKSPHNQENPNTEIRLTVIREGASHDVAFVPEGAKAPGYRWTRVPGIPESDCRY